MIGALSIVRFRHPVKSPLELIMYFALITVGIATSVRTKWAIQLIIGTILIILIVKFFQVLSKKYGKSFYNTSFNEGVNINTLEIITILIIIQTCLDCCCMRKKFFFFCKTNNLFSLAFQTFSRVTDNRACFYKVLYP